MSSSHTTPVRCHWFSLLSGVLDPRSAHRLAVLFVGTVLARGRRTVTSWIRAAGLSDEYRRCYTTVAAVGRRTDGMAARLVHEVVRPVVADADHLTLALDDTPTERYGPHVQGAGVHHNPTPGPAGSPFVYGHVWVVLGLLTTHPRPARIHLIVG
jgi:DDE superfamily endonuclease